LPDRIGLDDDLLILVDEHRAERMEDGAGRVDIVRRRAEPDAEWKSRLVAGFRSLEVGVERPVVGLWRAADGIHRLDIDAGVLLQEIDARAGALDLAAHRCRHGDPFAVDLAQIFDRPVDVAVLLDEVGHHVVDRLQVAGVLARQPGRHGDDVVTGFGLRLGGDRQQQLVALRRNEVHRDVDFLLLRPFLDERFRRLVGARHPVIPETDRKFSCGVRPSHVRSGDQGCRCRRRGDKRPAR
jgi:hypothetical protein